MKKKSKSLLSLILKSGGKKSKHKGKSDQSFRQAVQDMQAAAKRIDDLLEDDPELEKMLMDI